jgi:D-glycero-D-manno-heptose 1,7-bisphosphate phosphatase
MEIMNFTYKTPLSPVIFLDRDGTINEEVHYLHRPEDLKILPGVPQAIRRFREAGYLVVVITNQAGIGRGYYTEKDLELLNRYLNQVLAEEQAHIDGFYFCPHHPEHGIGKYKKACRCRKPDIGMFEQAEKDFPVDKSRSYMIGDKLIDTQAGHNFGIRSVLVGTGYGAGLFKNQWDSQPVTADYDHYAENLMAAADWIIGNNT